MIISFIFFYAIGALIFYCHTSLIARECIKPISSQMHLKDEEVEQLYLSYYARILFQTVMMVVFPLSFGGYLKVIERFSNALLISSGLFTVIWLLITGIFIKLFYNIMTRITYKKIELDCNKYFQNKEFLWIMCPILYGILFSIYTDKVFLVILAIVLGKYIWMDSAQLISVADMKRKGIELFNKIKIDLLLLACQAFVMGYLLLRWYPIKDDWINAEYIFNILFVLALFLMPIIDLFIYSSMRAYAGSIIEKRKI